MKDIINNLSDSLNNIAGKGWSGKKLTAFAIVFCDVLAHLAWVRYCVINNTFESLEMVLTIDYTFVATLFGINEYGKKIAPKNDETNTPA